jgi:hypothetical protein
MGFVLLILFSLLFKKVAKFHGSLWYIHTQTHRHTLTGILNHGLHQSSVTASNGGRCLSTGFQNCRRAPYSNSRLTQQPPHNYYCCRNLSCCQYAASARTAQKSPLSTGLPLFREYVPCRWLRYYWVFKKLLRSNGCCHIACFAVAAQ